MVKADESAVKFSEALQAKEREHASLVASLEEKQLKALEEKEERCKEETDAAMEAVEAAQLRANEAEAAARHHERHLAMARALDDAREARLASRELAGVYTARAEALEAAGAPAVDARRAAHAVAARDEVEAPRGPVRERDRRSAVW